MFSLPRNGLPLLRSLTLLLILIVCSATANDAQRNSTGLATDWPERSVTNHVNRAQYVGVLDATSLDQLSRSGKALFTAKFTTADGLGRPFATQAIIPTKREQPPRQAFSRTAGMDANACSSCHNDPTTGGAGDFTANVFVSEGFNNTDFDNTDPQFSNERNTNHLFGAGLVELLAREMSAELISVRDEALVKARRTEQRVQVNLISKDVSFGKLTAKPTGFIDVSEITGVDPDLIIKPFGQKGVITSLRQFSINALNHHHGMQATERFGSRWTHQTDFDADSIENEITAGDVSALVAWQASLQPPLRATSANKQQQTQIEQGEAQFDNLGCAVCHRPTLPLSSLLFSDPGPSDNAGTLRQTDAHTASVYDLAQLDWADQLRRAEDGSYLIPLFGDLKRHRIADQDVAHLGNELLAQRFVDRDIFITAELWGAASTAPYGHRGDLSTLDEIILAHGGDARASRDQYRALPNEQRSALIRFIKSLIIAP